MFLKNSSYIGTYENGRPIKSVKIRILTHFIQIIVNNKQVIGIKLSYYKAYIEFT